MCCVILQKYQQVVGNPLDLSLIRDKLEACEYDESSDCLNDLRAMFDGCRQYFKPGSVRKVIFMLYFNSFIPLAGWE